MKEPVVAIPAWKEWCAEGRKMQLVDVRSATEFAAGHLPGAVNIPLDQIELRTEDLSSDKTVVLICQAGTRARIAARLLNGTGKDLVVLDGGTDAWRRSGNPIIRSTVARWALERQVRLIAGLLVAGGVALTLLVSPWWLILPACIGCGLTFAGLTNFCPMGELLARLPWNRTRRASRGAQEVSCACECNPRN